MKRLIRHENGLYLQGDGKWTNDYARARSFPNFTSALELKQALALNKVEYLLMLEDRPSEQFDVPLPLTDS